ncbi:DUF6220 domain-containing protein [Shinella curvata]|uniref:DUF6220 domain-containing protein n=1 Tax=Shinella curvata TaxID=1817964 RepID=A0ABT8X832_9HYPH|nr:DUF6220 domain-containing protein [Shinella curvata]MCJ8052157.1 DUF6220 domain-containing protein [Shinella curvata]MDO6119895.1 DUF6220 domain-containing protein [Shinella curvata]
MMTWEFSHPAKPRHIVPLWYRLTVRTVPAGILVQYLLAGLGLFYDGLFLDWHGGLGMLLFLPITALVLASWFGGQMHPLRWWAGLLAMLHAVQVALITVGQSSGSGILQALHPFNGGLMLAASLVLLAKVERNRAPMAKT